jgi:hypothetical protein
MRGLLRAVLALSLLLPSLAAAQITVSNPVVAAADRTAIGDQIPAPVTNVSYATAGAGGLTGTYFYNHACATPMGETAPWPGTPSGLALSAQQVTVTVPACPAGSTGHVLYRSKTGNTEPKNTFRLTVISGAGAASFTDNVADVSLGAPAVWTATNRGYLTDGSAIVAEFSDQTTSLGQGATCAGYASTCIGYRAGASGGGGRRNTYLGVYAGENITTGYENTLLGVHSGNGADTAIGNTCVGYGTCGLTQKIQNFNTCVGQGSCNFGGVATGGVAGGNNVMLGFRTGWLMNAANQVLAVGYYAGAYANANRQLFIDTGGDRANLATAQDSGLIYGVGQSSAQTQELRLNAPTRLGWGSATVAQLPTCSATYRAFRAYVTDASVAYSSANVGATVAGGGSNTAPVFCNGSAWVIG